MTKNKKIAIVVTVCAAIFCLLIVIGCCMHDNYIQKRESEEMRSAAIAAEQMEYNEGRIADITEEIIEIKTKLDYSTLSRSEKYELEKRLQKIQEETTDIYEKEISETDFKYMSLDEILELLRKENVDMAKKYLDENDSAIRKAKEYLGRE